jgi:hypothetical protein
MATTYQQVNKNRPCPVCKGTSSNCGIGTDGSIQCRKCTGEQPGFRCLSVSPKDSQWSLYRHLDDERDRQWREDHGHQHNGTNGNAQDWAALSKKYQGALDGERGAELANALGVPECFLDAIKVGWRADYQGGVWTFPERNAFEQIIGITWRNRAGEKKAFAGSKRGLIVPRGWTMRADGPILLVEGASDVLALWSMGLCVFGRPSNMGGVEHLDSLLSGVDPKREIIVVGEWDAKLDGTWPGKEGAIHVATELTRLINRPVTWALPPQGYKDSRQWLNQQQVDLTCPYLLKEAGQKLEEHFLENKNYVKGETVTEQNKVADDWEDPVPLDVFPEIPPFPVAELPDWLGGWVAATARATQTPSDLAGMLGLVLVGAALATKYNVKIRDGWIEPPNTFGIVALESGERKTAVFREALAPVKTFEANLKKQMLPIVAAARAEHETMERRRKILIDRAAKAKEQAERDDLQEEVKKVAQQLALHHVPEEPKLVCDNVTVAELERLICRQGGRMLQAGPEGTAIEIAKGRFTDTADFEVYLKGHGADSLNSDRVGRGHEERDAAHLSVALTVQPDVVRGLAEEASMKARGFLARFLYAMPASMVGHRQIAPPAASEKIKSAYRNNLSKLWGMQVDALEGPVNLSFSPEADAAMQEFERWLEPKLAPGGELSSLSHWPKKLAGESARIAAALHAAQWVESKTIPLVIDAETVKSAIRIGRDYLLPHTRIAIYCMKMDDRVPNALKILEWMADNFEKFENFEKGCRCINLRDARALILGTHHSKEEVQAAVNLLVANGYLRPHLVPKEKRVGRPGSPRFEIHPCIFNRSTPSQNPQFSQNSVPE